MWQYGEMVKQGAREQNNKECMVYNNKCILKLFQINKINI